MGGLWGDLRLWSGIVCAAADLEDARTLVPRLVRVVPGIRPTGTSTDDQARAATPQEAIDGGADLLVVGRAVTQADGSLLVIRREERS